MALLQLAKQLGKAHRSAAVACCRRWQWRTQRDRGPANGQHLVQRSLVGDEIEVDELLACRAELLGTQVQPLRQRGGAVVAQALRIAHRDQEQIQRGCARVAMIDQVALHQRLINPAELLGHLAQPLGAQHSLDWLHCGSA
jgi:hypothetical protein